MISRAARLRLTTSAVMREALLRLAGKYRGPYGLPNPHHAAGRARTGGIPWRGKR